MPLYSVLSSNVPPPYADSEGETLLRLRTRDKSFLDHYLFLMSEAVRDPQGEMAAHHLYVLEDGEPILHIAPDEHWIQIATPAVKSESASKAVPNEPT